MLCRLVSLKVISSMESFPSSLGILAVHDRTPVSIHGGSSQVFLMSTALVMALKIFPERKPFACAQGNVALEGKRVLFAVTAVEGVSKRSLTVTRGSDVLEKARSRKTLLAVWAWVGKWFWLF